MTERNFGEIVQSWIGTITNVMDPHQSGRVQIRVFGRHDDVANIPDSDLPWAQVLQPVTSAARGRIGTAPVGAVVGSRVYGVWLDRDHQYPLVLGTVGRAGTPQQGQTEGGAPAIDISQGSIPPATQNSASNPYSSLYPSRVPVTQIDSGQQNIDSVAPTTGVAVTQAVEEGMQYATVPTTAAADPNQTDVLQILRSIDPTSALSAIPCLPTQALNIQIELNLSSIATGLVNMVADAVTGALLELMSILGIDQVINAINQATSAIASFADALAAIQSGGICGAPRALAQIGAGTQALARSYSSIQGAIQRVGKVPDAIRAVLGQTAAKIEANIVTDAFRPLAISVNAPIGFVQEYYTTQSDPYPGYIRWYNPIDISAQAVFTLRNGQPNYASAQEHVRYQTQDTTFQSLRTSITQGNLNASALTSIMTNAVNFGQAEGLVRTLGNGFNPQSIAGMAMYAATVAPQIIGAVQGIFQNGISVSVLTNTDLLQQAATRFTSMQTMLEMRRARLESAFRRI